MRFQQKLSEIKKRLSVFFSWVMTAEKLPEKVDAVSLPKSWFSFFSWLVKGERLPAPSELGLKADDMTGRQDFFHWLLSSEKLPDRPKN